MFCPLPCIHFFHILPQLYVNCIKFIEKSVSCILFFSFCSVLFHSVLFCSFPLRPVCHYGQCVKVTRSSSDFSVIIHNNKKLLLLLYRMTKNWFSLNLRAGVLVYFFLDENMSFRLFFFDPIRYNGLYGFSKELL